MTNAITWGPIRQHDGSAECPAEARWVPCMIRTGDDHWRGDHGILAGNGWHWRAITAYRIPLTTPAADEVRSA
ncbi:MAG: hypothetical protein ACRCT6_11425, partial [Notoacmeibacter sp.]